MRNVVYFSNKNDQRGVVCGTRREPGGGALLTIWRLQSCLQVEEGLAGRGRGPQPPWPADPSLVWCPPCGHQQGAGHLSWS